MENLKKLGFFSDLSYGDASQARLVDAKGLLDVDDRELDVISRYLTRGRLLAVSPGLSKDILSGEIIGTGAFQTDEVWTWHSDLSHYVRKHKVELPLEFLTQLRQNR